MRSSRLFSPLKLRGIEARNRIMVSPMAQYVAQNGIVGDWHLVHLGKFATGGAGIVFVETSKVESRGRGSVGDVGIWDDAHIPGLRRIAEFLKAEGAVAGIQLAHAGRKSRIKRPWEGFGPLTDQDPETAEVPADIIGPSALPAHDGWPVPREMSIEDINDVVRAWGKAAARADACGFDVIEIHGAHGYLIHQFLSPLANQRKDGYGGDFDGRVRFALELVESVRRHWPSHKPLFFRLSCVDDAGWDIEDSIRLARLLAEVGVDAVDCSSGGIVLRSPTANARSRQMGFQVPYARRIRREAQVLTIAVGLIIHPEQAETILQEGSADIVALGRELLVNPHWAAQAADSLHGTAMFEAFPQSYGWWLERRARAGIEP